MAYSTANPPMLAVPALGDRGPQIWTYSSNDNGTTVVAGAYFTNGVSLGMKVGDFVIVTDLDGPNVYLMLIDALAGDAASTGFASVTV